MSDEVTMKASPSARTDGKDETHARGIPNELREHGEHQVHHEQGDVGGKYHDQGKDGDVAHEHVEAAGRVKGTFDEQRPKSGPGFEPVLIIVMGVAACGKSTIGAGLARALGLPFIDADDLHPKSNVEKMSAGKPLNDDDREPWLRKIREVAVQTCGEQERDQSTLLNTEEAPDGVRKRRGIVVGCSALKKKYRDMLRGSEAALKERIRNRKGHFMKEEMLDSQLEALERPEETGEEGVVTVELEESVEDQIRDAVAKLKRLGVDV